MNPYLSKVIDLVPRMGLIKDAPIVDRYLSIVGAFFSKTYSAAAGNVLQVGSLEKTSVFTTTSYERSEHKYHESSQSVRGGSIGISSTKEKVTKTISLLRIGTKTFTDIVVPQTALYDILNLGENVGCVFNKNTLIYVHNKTHETKIGSKVTHGLYNLIAWLTLAVSAWCIFAALEIVFSVVVGGATDSGASKKAGIAVDVIPPIRAA